MAYTVTLEAAKAKSTVGADGRLVKTYEHRYRVKSDAGTRPSFADYATAVGVAPGSPYADDTDAVAGEAEIEHLPSRPPHAAASVKLKWSTRTAPVETDDTDPTTVRQLWELRPIIQQRYVTKDKDGKPILNSAKTPFDGGIPVDVRLVQATLKLRVADADFDRDTVLALSGRVNSTTFLGGAAGTVQLDVTATEAYEGSYHFWIVEYTFSYDPLGWQPKPLDAGFYHITVSGKVARITVQDVDPTSDSTEKVVEPEPLDVDGHVVPLTSRPAGCQFVDVAYFEEYDFATLPGL